MPTTEVFRVNYYVGAMLAQGGDLWIDESKIVFSPTSALDRAMGAKNVEIPFQQIRAIDGSGIWSRSFHIKTDEKVHKFEGNDTRRLWALLEKALPNKGLLPPLGNQEKPASSVRPLYSLTCDQCSKPLQPGYSFCPYCGHRLKATCGACRRTMDPSWAACAYCGKNLKAA